MHFLVAYDIVQDRRREKAAAVLKNYGLRVQYSVFECELTAVQAQLVLERLRRVIDGRYDRVAMYPLCDACFFRAQSAGRSDRRSGEDA